MLGNALPDHPTDPACNVLIDGLLPQLLKDVVREKTEQLVSARWTICTLRAPCLQTVECYVSGEKGYTWWTGPGLQSPHLNPTDS
jgi:hypothetical protein